MKFAYLISALAVVAGTASAQQPVETYTVTGVAALSMPGTPSGTGLSYTANTALNSLSFTPGSVTFNGQPVDFSGTEASWLASNYNGTVNIPTAAGPAVVTVDGQQNVTGPTNWSAPYSSSNTVLGPAFSPTFLDITPGPVHTKNWGPGTWSSPVVPELNGAAVSTTADVQVTGVDPVAGLINFSGSGTMLAGAPGAVPTLSQWGLIVMTAGLLGLGLWTIRKNAMRATPSPA